VYQCPEIFRIFLLPGSPAGRISSPVNTFGPINEVKTWFCGPNLRAICAHPPFGFSASRRGPRSYPARFPCPESRMAGGCVPIQLRPGFLPPTVSSHRRPTFARRGPMCRRTNVVAALRPAFLRALSPWVLSLVTWNCINSVMAGPVPGHPRLGVAIRNGDGPVTSRAIPENGSKSFQSKLDHCIIPKITPCGLVYGASSQSGPRRVRSCLRSSSEKTTPLGGAAGGGRNEPAPGFGCDRVR